MNTPICDFLKSYREREGIRLHMPGHKGRGREENSFDITEISGADSLFDCNGIILESEKNASCLFDTERTIYSVQGSTLAIQTMLSLVCMKSRTMGEKPLIVAVRNARRAFLNACALLDFDIKWVYPNYTQSNICSGEFSACDVEAAILQCPYKPAAVFVTSPDYLGRIADIAGISEACKRLGVTLLVDNAHGAYLNFLEENLHPISLGADMTADSAHKTLPVLTGGGYLHISRTADSFFVENAKAAMSLFGSTSPSYLIMASLDRCNEYLSGSFRAELYDIIRKLDDIKKKLNAFGWSVCKSEPLRLTVYSAASGMTGCEVADILRKKNIECEYADDTHIVFMISSFNNEKELDFMCKCMTEIEQKKPLKITDIIAFNEAVTAVSVRDAVLSPGVVLPAGKAAGRICSKAVTACPPGVAVVVPGEIISRNAIKILKKYSISFVNVVK